MRRCSSGETVDIPVISAVKVVQGKGGRECRGYRGAKIDGSNFKLGLQLFQILWAIKNLNREILCVR